MRPKPQEPADLVTFTEETLHEKFHFLWSAIREIKLIATVDWIFHASEL